MSQHLADDVYARLAAVRMQLSPKMIDLAGFISSHYVQAAFMTTRELAHAAGVSRATVMRLPSVLGYRSFEAFRAALQDRVSIDLSAVEHLRMLPSTDNSSLARLRQTIASDVESLQRLAYTISEADLDRFVDGLIHAERVVIVGFRFMSPLAWHFWYSLRKVLPNIHVFTHADSWLYDDVRLMSAQEVIVVIASARYSAEIVSLVSYAHDLGRQVFAITDTPLSPILPYAKVALLARSPRLDFAGSITAAAALINCVISLVAVRLGDQALARLEAIEESSAVAGAYAHSGNT